MTDTSHSWMPNITGTNIPNSAYMIPPSYWSNNTLQLSSSSSTTAAFQTSVPFNFGSAQEMWVASTGTVSNATWNPTWNPMAGWSTWPHSPPPIPKEAEIQAKELLKEFIGEEGLRVLEGGGVIRVGGEYEIDHLGNCYKLLPDGGKKRFCIIPDESMAWGDVLVNKIVPLICNPEECERVANWNFPQLEPA